MLSSKELRIGNWVTDEESTDVFYVYRLWHGGAELSSDESGSDDIDYTNEEMFGIPLTDAILWILGFVDNNRQWIGIEQSFISIKEEGSWVNDEPVSSIKYILYKQYAGAIVEIKYVHQLQNLYFDIMNKELITSNNTLTNG